MTSFSSSLLYWFCHSLGVRVFPLCFSQVVVYPQCTAPSAVPVYTQKSVLVYFAVCILVLTQVCVTRQIDEIFRHKLPESPTVREGGGAERGRGV